MVVPVIVCQSSYRCDMQITGAYILTDVRTKKFYVGSSENIKKRLDRHIRDLRLGQHHCPGLQELWGPAGLIPTIFPTETREEAYVLEQDIIDRFIDSPLLLNIGRGVKGGDNLSRHPNREDIIDKIKKTISEQMCAMTSLERKLLFGRPKERNGMWGRTHTPEVKAKIAAIHRGNQYNLGRKFSDEHRRQISEHAKQRIGKKNHFFGKQHSADTKQKLSEIMKAKATLPPNTRRVEVNGAIYASLTEASRQLGISPALMVYRLNKGKEGYRYVT